MFMSFRILYIQSVVYTITPPLSPHGKSVSSTLAFVHPRTPDMSTPFSQTRVYNLCRACTHTHSHRSHTDASTHICIHTHMPIHTHIPVHTHLHAIYPSTHLMNWSLCVSLCVSVRSASVSAHGFVGRLCMCGVCVQIIYAHHMSARACV